MGVLRVCVGNDEIIGTSLVTKSFSHPAAAAAVRSHTCTYLETRTRLRFTGQSQLTVQRHSINSEVIVTTISSSGNQLWNVCFVCEVMLFQSVHRGSPLTAETKTPLLGVVLSSASSLAAHNVF